MDSGILKRQLLLHPSFQRSSTHSMDIFNPKILDASIRDVASCLSDNQKADFLLYGIQKLQLEGLVIRIYFSVISPQLLATQLF